MDRTVIGTRLMGLMSVLALASCTDWADQEGPGKVVPAQSAFAVAGRGAEVSFVEYEAEGAAFTGVLVGPSREAKTLAGEASGRMAVRLRGGADRVAVTLARPANALTVRYSVPDGTESALTVHSGGEQLRELPLTAKYGWFYGGFPFTNDPAAGSGHHFYDHVRGLLDHTLPAGAVVELRCSCTIDLADFEAVAPPLPQPAGSVSVVDFGADPSGGRDSVAAFERALASGREVWIPAGVYLVPKRLSVDRVVVRGAGMWHSVLRGQDVGFVGGSAVRLADFAIVGEVIERVDADPVNGVGGRMDGGSLLERLFIQHTKVGVWLDGPFGGPPAGQRHSLVVRGNRIFDTTADGLNLHRGVSHVLVEHNVIRNTGDDGLAMWSDQEPDHHNILRRNTIQLPMLANGVGVYGGRDNEISDNVIADILVEGAGVQVANRFSGTVALSGVTTLAGNTVLRGGSRFPGIQADVGALFLFGKDSPITATIRLVGNSTLDSTFSGLHLYGARIDGVWIDQLTVERPGTVGVQIQAMGSATVTGSRVDKGVYLCDQALPFTLTVTDSTGLDKPICQL